VLIETIAAGIDAKKICSRMVTLESEHPMITTVSSTATTVVRIFSAPDQEDLLQEIYAKVESY
jgi:hypothetical protein